MIRSLGGGEYTVYLTVHRGARLRGASLFTSAETALRDNVASHSPLF
jgi:hypothetical protein